MDLPQSTCSSKSGSTDESGLLESSTPESSSPPSTPEFISPPGTPDSSTPPSTPENYASPSGTSPSSDEKALCLAPRRRLERRSFASQSSPTDTSVGNYGFPRDRRRGPAHRELPPIGVFWDIENCQVPRSKSAFCIVQRVRQYFFYGHRQTEFVVVCDVMKENHHILNDLQAAQVNVVHVSSTCKNAADEKLRQIMRHFGETYRPPATVVLISGDVNFASDISDLRYRKNMRIVLVHNYHVSRALTQYAHESYLFSELTFNLPLITIAANEKVDIYISNLPRYDKNRLKNRLKFLSDNCGGRVIFVNPDTGTAIIRFATMHFGMRAQRRLNGEDVFGRKIVAIGADQANAINRSHTRKITAKPYNANGSQQSISWQGQGSSRGDWRNPANRTPDPQTDNSFNWDPAAMQSNQYVELIITNLDASVRDLRTVLGNQLKQYAAVYSITLNFQDSKPTAVVKVANQQDAEFIISKMHRQKVGYRRISIAYARPKPTNRKELKERIVYMLQESPTNSIPLYLMLTILEKKYLMRVSLFEITNMREICQIVDLKGERLVMFTPEMLAKVPVNLQKPQQMHYCCVHCPNGVTDVAMWQSDMYQPPYVNVSLKEFAQKLNMMLSSHMGTLPLLSFTICYSHEFGEPLVIDGVNGVALEHLVTCVNNVTLKYESAKNPAKYIVWEMALKAVEPEHFNNSPLASSISLLRREFVDLLRSEPKCQIPLGKFVPAYHHHFGRQLRVADYGYTKLDDLLHSTHLSNVVQILGDGSNRMLTLSHSAQMRRFTSDLLRMLKNQVPKQVTLSEFKDVYFRIFHKAFNAFDYGVCTIEDLLEEIPQNIVMLNRSENEITIAIPQRIRTSEEIQRTKQFAEDIVKLLSHSPNNTMLFDKFIPHYHHHFGHQCKVSDYGFTKLIELFEAIPDTVKVEELPNGQRRITLTPGQSLYLLGNRILELIKKSRISYLPLDQLAQAYMNEYKTPLNVQLYNCSDLTEVVNKLADFVKISCGSAGQLLIPVQKDFLNALGLRVWSLLVSPPHFCDADKLIFLYYLRFQSTITIAHLEQLDNILLTGNAHAEYTVFLGPEHVKAAKLYHLLLSSDGQLPFANLENWYQREYGENLLQVEDNSFEKFLRDFSFLFALNRFRKKTSVSLNPKLAELMLPLTKEKNDTDSTNFWFSSTALVPFDSATRSSPPKPDTPPAANGGMLMPWQQQLSPGADMEFFISLPSPETPKYLPDPNTLISPAKNLLPAYPMDTMISSFSSAPDASLLPTPDMLLKRGIFSDDSGDSGVNNSHFASENEMDVSHEPNLGAKPKYTRTNPEFKLHM